MCGFDEDPHTPHKAQQIAGLYFYLVYFLCCAFTGSGIRLHSLQT